MKLISTIVYIASMGISGAAYKNSDINTMQAWYGKQGNIFPACIINTVKITTNELPRSKLRSIKL